jgi:Macroglobulin domain MG3
VKKYVLPTYSVNIQFPERVALPDQTFDFTVEALYTFGEAVEGEATVAFYVNEFNWDGPNFGQQQRKDLFSITFPINSKAVTRTVNIARDLGVTDEKTLYAEVVFTETVTGKTASVIGAVYLNQYGSEMFITSSDFYAVRTPYSLSIAVRKVGTGVPVSDL